MTLLRADDVCVTFGGVRAVDHVSLSIADGALVGLIGPNGAGKTTLIDALCGFTPATGELTFGDRRIDRLPAYRRARLGLSRTFQTVELFDDLTVLDNLRVAASTARWWSFLADAIHVSRRATTQAVDDAVDLLGLGDIVHRTPSEVSLGAQKRIGVARALASSPRMVLLDEPAAGLDSEESVELGAHLRKVCDAGVTMLLVDHDMGLVLGISDEVCVLESGRLIATGTPEEIRRNDQVVASYLGGTAAQPHATAKEGA